MTDVYKSNLFPLVSIVIPVYNGSNYMREAIDSALTQTYKNVEIIVINDGSTDNTEEIALSYGDKIRYLAKENGGTASALNLAIANMNGEYFSWLSHDDLYYPDKIEKQIKKLSELNDKNTILFSNWITIDNRGYEKNRTFFEGYKGQLLANPLFCLLYGFINGCTLLIPKRCFDQFAFDESLKTNQDYDLWYRMFPKFSLAFMPEHLIKYRIHEKQGTKTIIDLNEEKNQIWMQMIQSLGINDVLSMDTSVLLFYRNVRRLLKRFRLLKVLGFVEEFMQKLIGKKTSKAVNFLDDFSFVCYKIFIRSFLKIVFGRATVKRKFDLNKNHRI